MDRRCLFSRAIYLFLFGETEATWPALDLRRAVREISVPDQQRLRHEFAKIRRALDGETALNPWPWLVKGRRVRIIEGPLKGLEGVVDERRRQDRLILTFQTIGQATSLEIDASLLVPMD